MHRSQPYRRVFHVKHLSIFAILLIAFWVAGCTLSRNPITGRKRAYGYSWEQERQIGAQADQQIIQQYGVVDDQEVQAYVDRVAQRVLAESHVRRPDADPVFRETPFVFRVLDSPVVNAFALPGGYVYVTRGLLSYLTSEAQLAVVLGHEIGHVEARHASQRAFEQQLGQVGLLGTAILGQEILNIPAGNILDVAGTATQLLFLRYGREDELESDQLGVEYAARAGYEAALGADFFTTLQRINEREQNAIPTFLSTHPDPGNRRQRIVERAQAWEQELPGQQTVVGREALYNAIDGMVVGENPRQGFVQNGTFYHPDLRFRFPVPQGYQLLNQARQVVMLEPNQRAIMAFTAVAQNSVREAAAAFSQQQGVQVIESGNVTGAAVPAYFVVAQAQTEQGQLLQILSYYVEHGGTVYNFLAYAPQEIYANFQDTFLRTMRGFAPVTDPAILNVQPARLEIVEASRTAPFSTFIQNPELPPDLEPQDLAVLNQVAMDEVIEAGTLLKLTSK